jgi:uncharacterized protein
MTAKLDKTFIIHIAGDFLVYSPLDGISALINYAGVVELQKQIQLFAKRKANPDSKMFELANDLLNTPLHTPRRKTGEFNPEFLGIIPTRDCNGACNYCDFDADVAPKNKMSYALAADIVDWYTDMLIRQKRETIEIHFFGGEPMVASDVVEVIVHRARLLAGKVNMMPFFGISTNGQYSARQAQWLGNFFNKVVLSFDGPEEVHNAHRPLQGGKCSYEQALSTARILSDSNAELCIRCCISKLNVAQMEEITSWCCRNLRISAINFEILCSTAKTDIKGLFPPDPVDFALHFQRSREMAGKLGVEVIYASDISERPQVTSCPVGKDAVIVSPDGRISNCYLPAERWKKVNLDLDYGWILSKEDVKIEDRKLAEIRRMVEDKPRCENCFCQWSCAGGCHVGNSFPECSVGYDDFCRQTRLISAFSLLTDMGMDQKTVELMNSPNAIHNLVSQKSDKFDDFNK